LIELKTEFELEQVISMQFRNKICCCEEHQNSPSYSSNAKHKAHLFSV